MLIENISTIRIEKCIKSELFKIAFLVYNTHVKQNDKRNKVAHIFTIHCWISLRYLWPYVDFVYYNKCLKKWVYGKDELFEIDVMTFSPSTNKQ